MSGSNFTEVDLDRLADYVAGALDPAGSAQVAELVATRTDWAAALRVVANADERIRVTLRGYAEAHPEPMPADVATRLAGRLAAEPVPVAPVPVAPVLSLDRVRQRQRRGRRWTWTSGIAAALVLLAGGLAATATIRDRATESGSTTESSALQPEVAGGDPAAGDGAITGGDASTEQGVTAGSAPPVLLGTGPAGLLFIASGADYHTETLTTLVTTVTALAGSSPDRFSSPGSDSTGDEGQLVVPQATDDLRRLADPAALDTCVRAVRAEHPGTPRVVDFAKFDGEPALVLLIADDSPEPPTRTIVVVGSRCGLAGSHFLARVQMP